MKVYGSRHPMSKRNEDIWVAKIRKGRKTSGVHQPWGQGDGAEVRHLEPGGLDGVWDLFAKYCTFTTEY